MGCTSLQPPSQSDIRKIMGRQGARVIKTWETISFKRNLATLLLHPKAYMNTRTSIMNHTVLLSLSLFDKNIKSISYFIRIKKVMGEGARDIKTLATISFEGNLATLFFTPKSIQ